MKEIYKNTILFMVIFSWSLLLLSPAFAQELRVENPGTDKVYLSYGSQPVFAFGTEADEFFEYITPSMREDIAWFQATGQNQLRGYIDPVFGWLDVDGIPGGYHFQKDSHGKFDLDAFDPTFWKRIQKNIQDYKDAGILLQISFFEGAGHYQIEKNFGWNVNYWNPANNTNSYTNGMKPTQCNGINYWTDEPMRQLEENGDSRLLDSQKRWVKQILDHTALGNTYYDISHEMFLHDGGCQARYTKRGEAWIKEIIGTVREWELENFGKKIILGMDASRGNSEAIRSMSGFDIVLWGLHHEHDHVIGWRSRHQKPYIPDESWDSNKLKWHYDVAAKGQHVYAPHRTRKYILKMMADKVQTANVYGGFNGDKSNRNFNSDASHIREVWKLIVNDYPDMVIAENKIDSAPTRGQHMLASDTAAFVYLETGVDVESGSAANVSSSTLKLSGLTFPDGVVSMTVYHPSSGSQSMDMVTVSGGRLSLNLPSFYNDLAIILRVDGRKDESDNSDDSEDEGGNEGEEGDDSDPDEGGTGKGQPSINSPAPGSQLSSSIATWHWSANETRASDWWLFIGTREGQGDIYDSGNLHHATSHKVIGLPVNGENLYLTLWYRGHDGSWQTVPMIYGTVR